MSLQMLDALSSVCLSFGNTRVLHGLDLTLLRGEINCLLGPSGCGKSTLLRVVAGLLPPDAGRVRIRARDCAVVFQEPRLLPWLTVAENLMLALDGGTRRERHAEVCAMLAQMQLAGTEPLMPSQLSGGMAQRVGIARALLRRPEVLLMDEPFAALDAITRASQQRMLQALVAEHGVTCLFVTHDLDEALRLGRRVMVLRDGVIQRQFDTAALCIATIRSDLLAQLNTNPCVAE